MQKPISTDTASSFFFDFETPEVQKLVAEFKDSTRSEKEILVGLYLKIRDGWRYNPYRISFKPESLKASHVAGEAEGHCIGKSVLLTACYRALGIPARLHLAKVKNHIGVERFIEKFGNEEITPHGMLDVWNGEKWLKISPAFNVELCHKLNVAPLDFDGESDSLFHEFDQEGNQFMLYLEDYGSFDDVPLEFIRQNFLLHYPKVKEMMNENGELVF